MKKKLLEILERKKRQIREKHGAPQGCAKAAEEFEIYIRLAKAGIPPKYWDHNLDDLDRANAHVRNKLATYCEKFEKVLERGQGLFLVGSNGTGKTLSACMVLKEALKKGYTARFIMLNEIVSMMTDSTYDRSARQKFNEEVMEVDFLVIDDITKIYKNREKMTSTFVDLQFDSVFRSRANYNLPVIITSNHKREDALKSADEVLTNSLLSLFNEHLKDVVFLGKDRRIN